MHMKRILPTIVSAQFFCTSIWFASNAVMPDIIKSHQLHPGYLAHLTSAVQAGFIGGTLVYAVLAIADRFSPSRVFFVSAVVAALFNLALSITQLPVNGLLVFRFLTGFFLAGIYPVGMKIAADYYQQGLGRSLGLLVGALVLGTAFPHALKSIAVGWQWQTIVYATSALAIFGGLLMLLLVPDGPFRKRGQGLRFAAFLQGFKNKGFRAAAFGYFGHMWELYAFWAFVPVMLTAYNNYYPAAALNVPLLSFAIIASGSVACVVSGMLSLRIPTKKLATLILGLSCLCCLASPLFLLHNSVAVFVIFLFCWGLVVIADSPLFSTLVAQQAPVEVRGTSLTIVNCIGFAITIISIQILNLVDNISPAPYMYMLLAIGPVLGLVALLKK